MRGMKGSSWLLTVKPRGAPAGAATDGSWPVEEFQPDILQQQRTSETWVPDVDPASSGGLVDCTPVTVSKPDVIGGPRRHGVVGRSLKEGSGLCVWTVKWPAL